MAKLKELHPQYITDEEGRRSLQRPFKAPVGASLLANHAGLPAIARFASKLAPTQARTTGYARSDMGAKTA